MTLIELTPKLRSQQRTILPPSQQKLSRVTNSDRWRSKPSWLSMCMGKLVKKCVYPTSDMHTLKRKVGIEQYCGHILK
uniref:Uncharacterized protein n=1 Tax=Arundo donax TaxID=35708 RepID=A0A0A8ZJI6_ARUDO